MSPALPPGLDIPHTAQSLALGSEVCRRFYALFPESDERYGSRGREHCANDNAYLVGWVRHAQAVDAPDLFRRNAVWLHGLLMARGFPADQFLRNLELVAEVLLDEHLIDEATGARIVGAVVADLRAEAEARTPSTP